MSENDICSNKMKGLNYQKDFPVRFFYLCCCGVSIKDWWDLKYIYVGIILLLSRTCTWFNKADQFLYLFAHYALHSCLWGIRTEKSNPGFVLFVASSVFRHKSFSVFLPESLVVITHKLSILCYTRLLKLLVPYCLPSFKQIYIILIFCRPEMFWYWILMSLVHYYSCII